MSQRIDRQVTSVSFGPELAVGVEEGAMVVVEDEEEDAVAGVDDDDG